MTRRALAALFLGVGLTLGSAACIKKAEEPPELAINLFSGIRNFVSLGDTEADVKRFTQYPFVQEGLATEGTSASLAEVKVTHLFFYKDIGTKIYFREGRVVLMEIQEPFKGVIMGKTIKLFQFESRTDKSWGEVLEREFGTSTARGSGGRFGAEAIYYPWGDISYNKMGPNEIALYTDPAIAQYRQRNFGREIRLFK